MKNLSHRSFLKSASAAAVAITAAPTILNGSRWQTVAWSKKSAQIPASGNIQIENYIALNGMKLEFEETNGRLTNEVPTRL